jgi:hypothetical protein
LSLNDAVVSSILAQVSKRILEKLEKGKKLSVTLKIMAAMAREGHIDPRLFGLFVRSGVYREYGVKYLKPEQLDRVDVEAILEGLPGGES